MKINTASENADSSKGDQIDYGKMYDEMLTAVESWPEEKKDHLLAHVLSLYAAVLKAAERDPSQGHPLIKYISRALAMYGLKLNKN